MMLMCAEFSCPSQLQMVDRGHCVQVFKTVGCSLAKEDIEMIMECFGVAIPPDQVRIFVRVQG